MTDMKICLKCGAKTRSSEGECPICVGRVFTIHVANDESSDPDHYKGDIEFIDAMRVALGKEQFTGYLRGTIMKYLWRLGKKDQDYKEAKKALQYCQWLHDNLTDMPLSENIE